MHVKPQKRKEQIVEATFNTILNWLDTRGGRSIISGDLLVDSSNRLCILMGGYHGTAKLVYLPGITNTLVGTILCGKKVDTGDSDLFHVYISPSYPHYQQVAVDNFKLNLGLMKA